MTTMQDEIVSLLTELVRNKCVNPPGGEMRSIRSIERYLHSKGIDCQVYESAPERGNLFAEIEGKDEAPSLMFGPAHVDVVPVDDEDTWDVPPFEGVVKDGCVWGRGTFDMLYIVACQAVVFAHLWEEGFKPKGNLKLLIVSDEEVGGKYGIEWMMNNHPEMIKVDYLLTEVGGFPVAPKRVAVAYGEKGATWLKIRFRGKEQHGSMPFRSENAIVKMAEVVKRLTEYSPPKEVDFIKILLEEIGVNSIKRWLMGRKSLLPRMLDILAKDDLATARTLHSLSQMTISPNMCDGGTKVNIVPGHAKLYVDVRTLPGQDNDYVFKHIRNAIGPYNDDVEFDVAPADEGGFCSYGTSSDPYSPLMDTIDEVVKELKGPDYKIVPFVLPGGTDGRYFREKWGTHAYGFGLFDDTMDMQTLSSLAHGDNERVTLKSLDLTAKAHMMIAKRFLG